MSETILNGNPVAMDGLHLLIGSGTLSLPGGANSLTITKNAGANTVIEILISGAGSSPNLGIQESFTDCFYLAEE